MSAAVKEMPAVFRDGYERGRSIDRKLADDYVAYTMVGDPPADAVVAALAGLERSQAARFIQAGIENDERVLPEAPPELRDFFAGVGAPHDARFNRELARHGAAAFLKDSDMFLLSLVAVGLVENFATLIGQSFLSTGYTTQASVQRLRQSLLQVIESMLPGGLERYGDGWRLTIRARLVHAQARRNLLLSGSWDTAAYGVPVSASHLAFATAAFSALVLRGLSQLGVHPTRQQRESYIHIWRYIGWLVGVPEELLLNSEAEGLALLRVARACEPPPNVDSIIMAHTLVNSAALTLGINDDAERRRKLTEYGYRISRALIGDNLADQLDFPRSRTTGLLAGMRWKRRWDRALGRISPTARVDNFMTLLDATEMENPSINYALPDRQYE